ncbi:DNA polymerase iota isoform X3 [Nelusetta ayraudi]
MIRNPALRNVPLGIQQKYIIVTCNYVAREMGVTKLMSVTNAKEKCPQLVLVKGEDLTNYREMSYKMTEVLMSYSPLVERLGFDENFMDVTQMVDMRLAEASNLNELSFEGHVYNHSEVEAGDNARLAMGSHIAAELREAIHSKLGLTGCAGIATNKLLAKLVSGTFKPNQQTSLLPENVGDIMASLSSLRKVPGVGHQTAKRLQALGVVSVNDLQLCQLNDLVKEFGGPTAQRLKNLASGIDDSPVIPTGAPQSLSDEDSFKKMSSTKEVLEKVEELLSSLVERMHKDGRQPHTFRLTVRRFSATNKWFSRESRQAPIPNHVGQKITSGGCDEAVAQLIPLAMKLFHKMVVSNAAFHLTLINVCFSNLQSKAAASSTKGSIASFFSQSSSPRKTPIQSTQSQDDSSGLTAHPLGACSSITEDTSERTVLAKIPQGPSDALHGFKRKQNPFVATDEPPHQAVSRGAAGSDTDEMEGAVTNRLPPNVDPEVFSLLPRDIQQELLSSPFPSSSVSPARHVAVPQSPHSVTDCHYFATAPESKLKSSDRDATGKQQSPEGMSALSGQGREALPQSSDCAFPGNVDPKVFSELPPDVQRELLSEWKQQKLVLKSPSSRKSGQSVKTKDKKAAGKNSQANNLFKYFKPS